MPKILQIDTCLGVGSTGKIAEIIGSYAKQCGWECFIAHGSRYLGETGMVPIQIGSKFDEYCHYIISLLFDAHGLASKRATRVFIEEIKKIKPDVVHIHNIHGYYINYKILFDFLANQKIPTVITLHDFWLMTGHCAYINNSCNKWKYGCEHCHRINQYPKSIIDNSKRNWQIKRDAINQFSDDAITFVPVSDWLSNYTRASILGVHKIYTIPNGVDINIFKPFVGEHSKLYQSIDWTKKTIITIAARWTDANGYDDIIQLSRMIPKDTQIIMVGLDKNQLKTIPINIIGVSKTDNITQLVELYSASDILLNVSREVTFGLVTAEAMACGTPAVVYKGTAGEDIVNCETGYVISSFSELMAIVSNCKENKKRTSEKCRKRIIECFNSDIQFRKYIDLYDLMIHNNEKSPNNITKV
ncbi:MAG: glycosyltransferase [Dysgonamonadaceae bacterium]|nr:glycosyltransferase [Dysgonamonadaceae bacterium]MDD4729947.1 glycosyltransferase [Dysgonamonadaceae bacterium]